MANQKVHFNSRQGNPDIAGVEDIDPKELFEKRSFVKIVDVRRPDEYTGELGHVGGAELIVLDTLPERLAELSKDDTVVFVCRSGARSARAAAFAKDNGFDHVFNMKGGMILWNELDLVVEGRNE
ncbi:MAG: rhodanese-like domain-containing protein [Bdellovibrionales bacterium]|nr:rhodanese-like domain-containing protein [Bdellovibrionales bacterium]